MAQIRSKQIQDFLSTVNFGTLSTTDKTTIANAADTKLYIDSQISDLSGDATASIDSLEVALSSEISATNSDFVRVEAHLSAEIYDARLYTSDEMLRAGIAEGEINNSIDSLETALTAEISATNSDFVRVEAAYAAADSIEKARAEGAEGVLDGKISTEKGRIDAILLASDADKDSFAEIVSLINGVDTTNDDVFAGYVLSNNASVDSLELAITGDFNSIDTRALDLENALSAEISATNGDVTSINAAISAEHSHHTEAEASLETALTAEINATNSDFVVVNASIDSLETALTAEISATNSDFVRVEATLTNEIEALTTYVIDEVSTINVALSAEISATNGDITSIDTRLGAVGSSLVDSVDSLELALTAEISATNADFTSVNSRVSIEEGRVDAILLASSADKDSFAEIVSLINLVDTTNDTAFASYVLATDASVDSLETALTAEISATNSDVTRIDAALSAEIFATDADFVVVNSSIDSLETALTAEINATNSDFVVVNASIDSLEIALSAEISATNGDVTSLETSIGSLETVHGDRLTSLEGYIMEDVQVYVESFVGDGLGYTPAYLVQDDNKNLVTAFVNGHKVEVASIAAGQIILSNPGYVIDGDDTVVITYQG